MQPSGIEERLRKTAGYEIEGVPPGEYRISVDRDASRVVTIAGDAVVDIDLPLVQIGGSCGRRGWHGADRGCRRASHRERDTRQRTFATTRDHNDFGQFQLWPASEPGEIVLTVYKPGYEMHREKIPYSSPITNKTITLRKSAGVGVKVKPASTVEQIRPLFLAEKMPGTE